MMTSDEREGVIRLTESLISGSATEADFNDLQETLRQSEEARALYLEHGSLDSMLTWLSQEEGEAENRSVVVDLADHEVMPSGESRTLFRPFPFAAAAAIGVALIGLGFLWSQRPWEESEDFGALARVIESSPEASWTQEKNRITAQGGDVSVSLKSGATASLAPGGILEIIGKNEARLLEGKASFLVPEPAKGFLLNLPGGARIIDLGTAFEVGLVSASGPFEVRVLSGKVRLEDSPEGSGVAGEGIDLAAGGRARMGDPHAEWLIETGKANDAMEKRRYRRLIEASGPVAYWDFSGTEGAMLTDTLEVELRAGPRPPEFPLFDAENTAAFFGRTGTLRKQDFGNESDLDFDQGDEITLEAWVAPSTYREDRNAYIIGKGRTDNLGVSAENQNYSLRLRDLEGESRPSFLFRSAPDAAAGLEGDFHRWTTDRGILAGSGWHHVAVSYRFGDPESVRAWVDGEAVGGTWDMGGSTSRRPVVDNDELWLGSSKGGSTNNTFDGAIDEVAIYRRILPETTVREHAGRR